MFRLHSSCDGQGPIPRLVGRGFCLLIGCCFFQFSLFAGSARVASAYPFSSEDIRIDGLLSESVWDEVPPIGEFVQVEPRSGAPPTQSTEVRVAYSRDALYIGVRCLDDQPRKILATNMSRDARLFSDDTIEILIDTFNDGRNAFYFQTNPLGILVDGRITENRFPDNNWDGIWYVRSQVLEEGWSAEFQIPFKTLSFQAKNDTWGFNVERRVGRTRERSRWASPSLDIRFHSVAMAGAIEGLYGFTQGVGLDIKPYGLAGYSRDLEEEDTSRPLRDGGVDIFYRVTSNLTSSTTVNTDFAETEADARQVNLTRFSLFFPEKRSFFLEDAGIFDFGIASSTVGGGGTDMLPFFSRTIGLVDNEPVPIRFGQKLTGKVGRFDVGLLDVMTGATGTVARQNLFVGRAKTNFWSQSYFGALITNGEPTGERDNSLLGLDMKLATANFLKTNKNFAVSLYGAKTWTPEVEGKDTAYGFKVEYPNDLVSASLEWLNMGQNYNPALGYVQRDGGLRKTSVKSGLNPRPEAWGIRQLGFSFAFTRYQNLTFGEDETRNIEITPLELSFDSGSRFEYQISPTFERLIEPFDIRNDISIPAGDYSFNAQQLSYLSAFNRSWRYRVDYEFGSFYTGNSKQLRTEFVWDSSKMGASFDLRQYWVRLREGNFTTRLALMRINYSFSPLITLSNFVQYDTDSRNIGLQSRLRWIVRPGNEVYLVLNHAWQEDALDRFASIRTDVRAKLSYTFRF